MRARLGFFGHNAPALVPGTGNTGMQSQDLSSTTIWRSGDTERFATTDNTYATGRPGAYAFAGGLAIDARLTGVEVGNIPTVNRIPFVGSFGRRRQRYAA